MAIVAIVLNPHMNAIDAKIFCRGLDEGVRWNPLSFENCNFINCREPGIMATQVVFDKGSMRTPCAQFVLYLCSLILPTECS